ncbi:MAG TPA: hypothetical protein VFV39_00130, partial [Limnobacter sp.]|nr:hypothetical protein [Limnobacter sp.]
FGIDLALRQQMHRQRYGKYAETVASTGNSNINRLVMPSASQYNVNVLSATFHGYRVEVSQRPGETATMPEQCRVLVVESDMGIQRFGARSASNQNTSARCIPHG